MITQPAASAVDLEGIINFRDFGGWPTTDGGSVRRGRLFRSAHHASATPADLAWLAELGIELLVDLRASPERARDPALRPEGFAARVIQDERPSESDFALHLEFLSRPEVNQDWITERMVKFYLEFPFAPPYSDLYRDYFQALAEIDGPVLVNCHAGKDRTGVLCALTLHVLGVATEGIFEDYLTTNRMNRTDARLAPLLDAFERDHGVTVDPELIRHTMLADARYLDAAFAEMTARFGDVDAYLETVLGVSPALKSRLRERLVEPS